jgi:hypothetical protein
VHAEPEHADRRQGEQAGCGAQRGAHALAPQRRGEDQKREQEAGRDLDSDAGREGRRPGAQARAGTGGQRERDRQREDDERVVVRAANREHKQDRVEPDEGRRPTPAVSHASGSARDQRRRGEARRDGRGLQRPQASCQPERRRRIAREREEGAVGRVLERPADKGEGGVGGRFGRHVGVGIEAVQGAHAGEGEVAEDVLGDERRPEQQDDVGEHDGAGEHRARKPPGRDEHEQIGPGHDQHQRLEAGAAETRAEALERARQPIWPAPAARWNELRRGARRAGGHQEDADEHAEHAEHARRARGSRGHEAIAFLSAAGGRCALRRGAGYGSRGLYEVHCYPCPTRECPGRSLRCVDSRARRGQPCVGGC